VFGEKESGEADQFLGICLEDLRQCVGLLADSPPPSEPVTILVMTPPEVSLTNMVSSPEPPLVRSDYPNPGGEGGESADLVPRRARIRLGLTLVFPDGERLDQRYSAHPSWTVSQFKERMGSLLGTLYPIRLLVGPDWEELDHLGRISDTTLPGSPLHCPFLTHNSVVRVSQCPSWTGGLLCPSHPWRITLTFPDGEREDQAYTLHRHMLVSQLKRTMQILLGNDSPVVLAVSPDWAELDHLGLVSARVFPNTAVACPYLSQDSTIKVRSLSSVSRDDDVAESSAIDLSAVLPCKHHNDGNPPQMDGLDLGGTLFVTPSEKRKLTANFRAEAKLARSDFRDSLVQEWHRENPPIGDKENCGNDRRHTLIETYADDDYDYDYFVSVRMETHDRWATEIKATFLASLRPRPTPDSDQSSLSVRLHHDRVQALWEGLRRMYFGGNG
jgi:hypothetical protein